ncbi:MAG TPA: bifunctional anthranilate synthase component I family protein/class IV aminotransferase [Aquabacterium sp.]|nr:bifunctional anthranilate synthase component I family protein/class IV aminotransferase [Aquabacterium sp.]HRH29211.1 bifunctional anthranilate synthase component I family protein/class IV aminotransferase [Aquabacterium sp.]
MTDTSVDAWPTAIVDFPRDPTAPGSDALAAASRQRLRFGQPIRWLVAHDPSQVARLLDDAHDLSRQGHWCVGWVAYEAAPAFDPHLPVKALPPGVPYAVWAVYDQAEALPPAPHLNLGTDEARWHTGPWSRLTDEPRLHQQVEAIRELIRQGEVYQINLTSQLQAPIAPQADSGDALDTAGLLAFFQALHRSQPLGYSVFLDTRAVCRGPGAVLSVSPELFVDWHDGLLTTRPMKGTSARQDTPQADEAAAAHLRHSAKERAENLMIVDLLRNDLSKVAQLGTVQVPSLFDVQALPTVWQMTSTVQARSREGLRLSELFTALFPCGSVTGAPKRQAMHHIARLEPTPRGVYCGAVGLMAPGGRVTLNVPIRTVCVQTPPPMAPWQARCGVGSGITLDATPAGEADEWRHKQAFLRRADQPFELLESLRLEGGQMARLDRHLARLSRSAAHFGHRFDAEVRSSAVSALLALGRQHPDGVHKVRLLLSAQGHIKAEAAPLPPSATPARVVLAERAMPMADDFIRHKTTLRSAYEAFKAPPGCLDILLFNAQDELTEFTIGNVAVCLEGQWLTPPLRCGLLPGVMRESLLADGRLQEAVITRSDLSRAQGLALLNSVRGWVDVELTR